MTNFQLFITVLVTTLGLLVAGIGLGFWIELLIRRRQNHPYKGSFLTIGRPVEGQ